MTRKRRKSTRPKQQIKMRIPPPLRRRSVVPRAEAPRPAKANALGREAAHPHLPPGRSSQNMSPMPWQSDRASGLTQKPCWQPQRPKPAGKKEAHGPIYRRLLWRMTQARSRRVHQQRYHHTQPGDTDRSGRSHELRPAPPPGCRLTCGPCGVGSGGPGL